jgi:hypothetical protein
VIPEKTTTTVITTADQNPKEDILGRISWVDSFLTIGITSQAAKLQ